MLQIDLTIHDIASLFHLYNPNFPHFHLTTLVLCFCAVIFLLAVHWLIRIYYISVSIITVSLQVNMF
jgi:hypothetical protein